MAKIQEYKQTWEAQNLKINLRENFRLQHPQFWLSINCIFSLNVKESGGYA